MAFHQAKSRTYKSLPIDEAIAKVCAAAERTWLRRYVKDHERIRVEQAFTTLNKPHEACATSKDYKNKAYQHFLRQASDLGGIVLVMVCVVGLGRSVISAWNENARLRFPVEIKKNEKYWSDPLFQSLAEDIWRKVQIQHHSPTSPQDSNNAVAHQPTVVEVAEWVKVKGFLQSFISSGVQSSITRNREGSARLTATVRLRLPLQEGEDVLLEVLLHTSFGECIAEVSKRSLEELRVMLGDYLFTAMNSSNMRKKEDTMVSTKAVNVREDCSGDSKLGVMLNFDMGLSIWESAFPDMP